MKQNQPINKGIIILLLFFFTVTIISAQSNFLSKKNDNNVKLENVLLQKLREAPTFAKDFKNVKNLNLTDLLKSQVSTPHIDSVVSASYDTSYQKVKNTYQYDANGYLSNFLKQFYDEGQLVGGENINIKFRPDGKFKSYLFMDFRNGVWINNYKVHYAYDPSGNVSSTVDEKWDTTSTSWVYVEKHDYTYDANHNVISDVKSKWSSGAWVYYSKDEWSYDSNNNQTLKVRKEWSSGAWVNSNKNEWTYDANNNKILNLYYHWNNSTSVWKESSKDAYTYDANNNLISENHYSWSSSSSTWNNSIWKLYTYNANNKITFENEKKWDTGTSSWVDNNRVNYTYNASDKILNELEEDYDGTSWEKDEEYTFTYDANNRILSYIDKNNWNGSDWNKKDKYNFRYNSLGICNGSNHETWFASHWVSADVSNNNMMFLPRIFDLDFNKEFSMVDILKWYTSMIPGYEYSVYYAGITDVKESDISIKSFTLEQNYPNPFNPSTKISYSIPNSGYVTLKVYDILGNEITTLVNENQSIGKYSISFNASNLTSGIYFYQLSSGNFIQVRKMMLLK